MPKKLKPHRKPLADLVAELQGEIDRLRARVMALESRPPVVVPPCPQQPRPVPFPDTGPVRWSWS